MSDPIDIPALLALDAARTPGEWEQDRHFVDIRHSDNTLRNVAWCEYGEDATAIVAAVNALGPLCRRVEELEKSLAEAVEHASKGWSR